MYIMESVKKQQERYFRYTLTGRFANGDAWDGFFKFNMPPLSALGFTSPSGLACICKIRQVKVNSLSANSAFRWARVSDKTGIDIAGGINVLTNISSRNVAFMGTDRQVIEDVEGGEVLQRFGCCIDSTDGNTKLKADDSIDDLLTQITYEDFSDVKSAGTLCSVPFGQELKICFSASQSGSSVVPLYTGLKGGVGTANGAMSVEIEFLMV